MMDSVSKLRFFLKTFKRQCDKNGFRVLDRYPAFCMYLDKNKDRFRDIKKVVVLDIALDILLED